MPRLMWHGMNIQVEVAPLFEKAASIVLRNRPASPRSTKPRCSCGQKVPTLYLERTSFSQLFIQEEHGWATNAWGGQCQCPSGHPLLSSGAQRMLNLSWSMRWAEQAKFCPGAWLLPHCLSEMGNSTTTSAKSRTGRVTRWTRGITWLTV